MVHWTRPSGKGGRRAQWRKGSFIPLDYHAWMRTRLHIDGRLFVYKRERVQVMHRGHGEAIKESRFTYCSQQGWVCLNKGCSNRTGGRKSAWKSELFNQWKRNGWRKGEGGGGVAKLPWFLKKIWNKMNLFNQCSCDMMIKLNFKSLLLNGSKFTLVFSLFSYVLLHYYFCQVFHLNETNK